ncbi:hypothetical protein GCK32_001173 [Trichostrongylus colubriformis]|uniref:Uncharacterized protein n=1 Tax=Trichostrongylus colubriformis TaxID=6319 RepID=A0AAN8IF03_TRICO
MSFSCCAIILGAVIILCSGAKQAFQDVVVMESKTNGSTEGTGKSVEVVRTPSSVVILSNFMDLLDADEVRFSAWLPKTNCVTHA